MAWTVEQKKAYDKAAPRIHEGERCRRRSSDGTPIGSSSHRQRHIQPAKPNHPEEGWPMIRIAIALSIHPQAQVAAWGSSNPPPLRASVMP
jgi:hypothetical protein